MVRPNGHTRPLPAGTFAIAGGLIAVCVLQSAAWGFSARPLIRPTGNQIFGNFGSSVSDAGDVNGDGHPDVIVGAMAAGTGGTASVFFGGPGADDVPDWTLNAQAASDLFGISVSGAGDVNGDGFADVIVGARDNDAGGNSAGRAYVYYGGPAPDAVADLTFTGTGAGDFFGASVSGAGDFNGDGFGDVIVGAFRNSAAGSEAGRAYLFYGGPGADAVPDLTLSGFAAGYRFGRAVSGAGDRNGDGYDDVIVGASGVNSSTGRVQVFHGGPGADTVADATFDGEAPGDLFGVAVSDAGDVNGDGRQDLIVGAYGYASSTGRAYVFYGGGGLNPDLILTGAAAGDEFGISVSGAGDVNRDGHNDVIVGADFNDAAGFNAGRAYLYFGGPITDTVADVIVTGEGQVNQFGGAVSGAGDWDGDGYDEVMVGAVSFLSMGRTYVYTSRPYEVLSPNGGEQWVAGTSRNIEWLGADPADLWVSLDGGTTYSMIASGVGSMDRNEFTITVPTIEATGGKVRVSASGEPVTNASSDASNEVFRIVSPSTPPSAASRLQLAPVGTGNNDSFGQAVSSAGDMNGDGYPDIVVGAPFADTPAIDGGRAYVFLGGPIADLVPDLTMSVNLASDKFGSSVSNAGDVNGDGYSDIIVGEPENDNFGSNAGSARIVWGSNPLTGTFNPVFGEVMNDLFGTSVAGAGDVNRDGFSDFIVGAPFNSGGRGRAYVYFGGVTPGTPNWVLSGEVAGDKFGHSVSSAGDVNGDGYSDVIVGARSAGGTGRAYIYYGGPSPDTVPDMTMNGAESFDFMGETVSGAGDMNGDGFGDVVVGASGSNAAGADAGRAYVFFGGPELDGVADLTLTGENAGDFFGIQVASAGDVNKDGFSDVVIGAFQSDEAGISAGRAYVFYGGNAPDAIGDVVLNGQTIGGFFGISVASAGDLNADGFSDVIVGAPSVNTPPGFGQGAAYVFDMNRYHLLSPKGGETWHVGSTKTVSWLGAEPADLWLSVDGGNSYELLNTRMGGSPTNAVSIRVPHTPTKFAMARLTPSDTRWEGSDRSDSLFTIQTSVALLSMLASPLPEGGASVTWQTDPGPEDLAGYKVEKAEGPAVSANAWLTLVALTRETTVTDPAGGPGTRYRLFAVNGLGEELFLGEASIRPLAALSAWPLPYRGAGALTVSFATIGGLGGGAGRTELLLFDVSGRLVRRLDSGMYGPGYRTATWDGRDAGGQKAAAGIYFLRTKSEWGYERSIKVPVLR